MTYCKGCLSKQQKINELEEEITFLKSKLRKAEIANVTPAKLVLDSDRGAGVQSEKAGFPLSRE